MSLDPKSAETLAVVRRMEAGLAANENDMTQYFHEDFLWRGNQGCGTKNGVEAFRNNWQLPFRAAFTDRDYITEKFMADGEWASCFGHIEATHSGTFMGIPATGKRVRIPYMDFWRVEDGRIVDNPVSVDFASVLMQLGVDIFDGKGWEHYDSGAATPPKPE
ncbi:ester cyclase [Boseongicola aestuarii]|jgi:predicted ester cyclase|uniref:SnoaL-like polyketide cyclase n=1 Tax=Boseongicola aestuarii TaxID=1470561 RepID=A0A238J095_9RHOB|nr:ester cyclase [Boseongicola aestuarii]SMX23410.1 SnoaL-like polyketide cyclase [Boseongicola aestuarii]